MKPTDYWLDIQTDRKVYPNFYNIYLPLLYFYGGEPISVLEIGCTLNLNQYGDGHGSSHAFSRLPFVKEYVGIDVSPPQYDFGEKATYIEGDGYSENTIQKIRELNKKFHLIIDDANHHVSSQTKFFKLYEQFSAVNSIMVLEDVHFKNIQPIIDALGDKQDLANFSLIEPLRIQKPGTLFSNERLNRNMSYGLRLIVKCNIFHI